MPELPDVTRRITAHLSTADPVLARVIAAHGPCTLRADRSISPFQHLAHAIAHQQLNGTAARTIFGRFVALYGADGSFPSPHEVLATPIESVRAAGFSGSKVAALRDLAQKTIDGVVPQLETLLTLDDAAIIERLTAVRGIGPWTVQMMLMFQLGRPDVLPVDDFGVRQGFQLAYGLRKMPTPRALHAYGVRWAPYRSAAAWYLWRAVDLHREQKLPEPLRPAPRLRPASRRRRVRKPAAARARK